MDTTFQCDYAKIVIDFVQKMPPGLNVTTQEIDAYFRECVLYLLSYNEQMRSSPNPRIINQLYTEVPVRFSAEQLASKIDCSQSDKSAGVAVPDFFHRMLTADVASGTRSCCEFIRVQREVLMLYASFDTTFSFEEGRRLTYLCDQLTAICIQEGVTETTTLEDGEPNISQDAIKNLNNLLKESADSVFRKPRNDMSKYTKCKKAEQESEADSILESTKKIVQKLDQMVDGPESESKDEDHSDLSDIVYSRLNASSLPQGKLPSWAQGKGVFPDAEIEYLHGNVEKPTVEESLAKLDRMIGLKSVKDQVNRLIIDIYINGFRPQHGLKNSPVARHLVFSGNPGTGKTTVARILSDIYGALGILSVGHLIEVDRSGLVGAYLGQTEEKTKEVIESALGGVLFIDEAYSLAEDEGDQYGRAAINTILKAMEDHYDDLVVIVAGYDELMDNFIDSNPGLKSRFATKIKFENYNGEELYEIFAGMVRNGDDQLDEQAVVAAKMYFNHMYETRDENFGNGRDVRNSYDKIRPLRSERLARLCKERGTKEPTKEELMTITQDDFRSLILLEASEAKIEKRDSAEKAERRIQENRAGG